MVMSKMRDDISGVIKERSYTHGEYLDNSRISQELKRIMRGGKNWDSLHMHEKETLEMISGKIGRLLSGDPHEPDHYLDIAGYAQLSAERNKKNED